MLLSIHPGSEDVDSSDVEGSEPTDKRDLDEGSSRPTILQTLSGVSRG